jgi:GAF domain-containing protein
MSANSWLAIDVGTAPMVRAQELRFAWERFVEDLERGDEGDGDPQLVRTAIVDSWKRSFAAGIEPAGARLAPVVADEDETHALWEQHPLARTAPLIRDCLAATAEEGGYLIVISDADGVLLSIEGNPAIRLRAEEVMNFAEGTLWSEPGAGTNAIGTAVAVDHAVQVFGPEHFHEPVQRWVCSAAPIHDPDTGALIGVIDLTGDFSTVHPASLAVATATAAAVEGALQLTLHDRDARLRARYGDAVMHEPDRRALVAPSGRPITRLPPAWRAEGRLAIPPGGGELVLPSGAHAVAEPVGHAPEAFVVRAIDRRPKGAARPLLKLSLLGRDRALLEIDGRPTELRRRLAEILALLCDSPHGMSAESLCADLHGDGGSVSSVRVEVSRLRKLLGPWIDTERYRLTCDVETDARRIEGLLNAGDVREAAEQYAGPLLPGSEAPGVIRAREHLEAWLRQAVLTADDPDAVWAWVHSPGGEDDVNAWKRLLGQLEFRDPRRSLCATRVAELRAALM